MKATPSGRTSRRHFFVLTPEEKRTACFVLLAFLLGIGTKRFRETQAVPFRKTGVIETAKTVALPAQRRAEAKRRKAAK